MSEAIRAKTARARAGIAARMLRKGRTDCRAFSDCFEMGDGDQVMAYLLAMAIDDPELIEVMEQRKFTVWARKAREFRKIIDGPY